MLVVAELKIPVCTDIRQNMHNFSVKIFFVAGVNKIIFFPLFPTKLLNIQTHINEADYVC